MKIKVQRTARKADYTIGNEEWKDIPGYENQYQASTFGNIRSVTRTVIRRNGVVSTYQGRLLIPYSCADRKGRKHIVLSKSGKPKTYDVAVIIAKTFLGEKKSYLQVDHINEDPSDNHIKNLRYLTQFENSSRSNKGKFRKSRGNKMENNPKAKTVVGYSNHKKVEQYGCAKYLSQKYGINYSTLRKHLQNEGITINNIHFKYVN